jgi:hypothetical protein
LAQSAWPAAYTPCELISAVQASITLTIQSLLGLTSVTGKETYLEMRQEPGAV